MAELVISDNESVSDSSSEEEEIVAPPPVPTSPRHAIRATQASTRTRMESLNANDAGLVSGATR